MSTTTFLPETGTLTIGGRPATRCSADLMARYARLVDEERLSWTVHHRLLRELGSGGQGIVYLSERRGADNFTLPVALKIFSPERYDDARGDAEGNAEETAGIEIEVTRDALPRRSLSI